MISGNIISNIKTLSPLPSCSDDSELLEERDAVDIEGRVSRRRKAKEQLALGKCYEIFV